MSPDRTSLSFAGLAAILLPACIFLTGCGLGPSGNVSTSAVTNPASSAGGLRGIIHGGQQPVVGSAVALWAAGTTGTGASNYGANATNLATTTTDSNGFFTFDNGSGVSPCTTGQYLYITATGGNPGAGTNNALAMLAAIPTPCGSGTGATNVWIDEVTTVATVTALQQFMSINTGTTPPYSGTGTAPWQIGAPSTNVTGLANAFTQAGNLASISTGYSGPISTTYTVGGTSYTSTITPNSALINTLANILAACVNGSSTLCGNLMADTTPGSSPAPVDTIQAMYYLATNPAGFTMNAHGNTQGSPYYLCNTYPTTTPPFAPSQTCSSTNYPLDWTIQATLANVLTNTPTTYVGTTNASSIAIDGSGNLWTANSFVGNATATIAAFNPAGQLLFAPQTTVSVIGGYTYSTYSGTKPFTFTLPGGHDFVGENLAIDLLGNAWYAGFYGNTYAAGGTEGVLAEITPSGTGYGYLAGTTTSMVAVDAFNDILESGEDGNGKNYLGELVNTGTPLSPIYGTAGASGNSTYYGGLRNATGSYNTPFMLGEVVSTNPNSYYVGGGSNPTNGYTAGDTPNARAWIFPAGSDSTTAVTNLVGVTPDPYGLGQASGTSSMNDAGYANGANAGVPAVSWFEEPNAAGNFGVVDANGNMWVSLYAGQGSTSSYIEYVNNIGTTATSNVLSAPVITKFLAGATANTGSSITEPYSAGVAANATPGGQAGGGLLGANGPPVLDGASNLWIATNLASQNHYGGAAEYSYSIVSGTPTIQGTAYTAGQVVLTPLSPNGTSCAWGFGNQGGGSGVTCTGNASTQFGNDAQALAIDSSGNVWVANDNGSVVGYIVGVAAPVATPLAQQLYNCQVKQTSSTPTSCAGVAGTVGVRP